MGQEDVPLSSLLVQYGSPTRTVNKLARERIHTISQAAELIDNEVRLDDGPFDGMTVIDFRGLGAKSRDWLAMVVALWRDGRL